MDRSDRIGFAVFFVACLFLAFLGGAAVMLTKVFPSEPLSNAYKAGRALVLQREIENSYVQTDQWREARTDARGTTVHDPAKAYAGYTLYTRGGSTTAHLIGMDGDEVHRWSLPYRELWNTTPDGRPAQRDELMYWRKAIMQPNGDLIAIYIAAADTPWGYGMVKLDADSNVIWSYHGAVHHDFDLGSDGRVLALTHGFRDQRYEVFSSLAKPFLDDWVVVIDGETGEPQQPISVFDAFYESKYQIILTAIPYFALEDPLHTNSIQLIDEELASVFAPADGKANQALISMRHPAAPALIDLDSGEMTWATKGPWHGQHSIQAWPNGNFTVFDNYGHYTDGDRSRILEVDPATGGIVFSYDGSDDKPLESKLRAAVTKLPNGNYLITESDGGRLLEVSPQGEIVWEFVNPVRGGDNDQFIPVMSSGQRLAADELTPEFRARLQSETRS